MNTDTYIRDVGEINLLRHLLPLMPTNDDLLVGPGDDCAVVRGDDKFDLLLKTDCIVEGLHFLPETDPQLIGRKALARAISDIGAMGGVPKHALVSMFSDPQRSVAQIEEIYRGLRHLAEEFQISIAGGESSGLPDKGLILSIALTGIVPRGKAVLRSTAKLGDLIAVTGILGGSFSTEHHLTFTPRVREGYFLSESGLIHSMMDLSDGLGADLPRLALASGLGYSIDLTSLPIREACSEQQAVSDGEDYELLLTFPQEHRIALTQQFRSAFPNVPLTVIGCMTESTQSELPNGYRHFQL